MKRRRDRYDDAIDYLTEHPDEIVDAWGDGRTFPDPRPGPQCLFNYVAEGCGCLTQIRDMCANAPTESLTEAIRSDNRIPSDEFDITVDELPVFAEWQRTLDAMREAGDL